MCARLLAVKIAPMQPMGALWTNSCMQVTKDQHRPELAWIGTETNEFGTDEFMKWCEVVGTEPYLCLNFGTGTLAEGKSLMLNIIRSTTDLRRDSFGMARVLQLGSQLVLR